MDSSEKRKCSSPEISDCQKEIIHVFSSRNVCDTAMTSNIAADLPGEREIGNGIEECHAGEIVNGMLRVINFS
jgi:hypothetical protein